MARQATGRSATSLARQVPRPRTRDQRKCLHPWGRTVRGLYTVALRRPAHFAQDPVARGGRHLPMLVASPHRRSPSRRVLTEMPKYSSTAEGACRRHIRRWLPWARQIELRARLATSPKASERGRTPPQSRTRSAPPAGQAHTEDRHPCTQCAGVSPTDMSSYGPNVRPEFVRTTPRRLLALLPARCSSLTAFPHRRSVAACIKRTKRPEVEFGPSQR